MTYIWTFILLLVALSGCQKATIDVKKEQTSAETKNWNTKAVLSVFSSASPEVNKSCEIFNAKVTQLVDSLQNGLKKDADSFFELYPENSPERPVWNYEIYTVDSVFSATPDFISLRVEVYTFSGGAHGSTGFYAFNYDVKKQVFLEPDQIVDLNKSTELNALLVKNLVDEYDCFTEKPTVSAGFDALNVSPESVCFTYPQYVLGPYSCGWAQISIPKTELKGILK